MVTEWHIQDELWVFLRPWKGRPRQKSWLLIPLAHRFPGEPNRSMQRFSLLHLLHSSVDLCIYDFWRQWLLLNYRASLSDNILTSLEFHILRLMVVLPSVIFFIRLSWQQRDGEIFFQVLPVCYPDEVTVCLWLLNVTALIKHLPDGHVWPGIYSAHHLLLFPLLWTSMKREFVLNTTLF